MEQQFIHFMQYVFLIADNSTLLFATLFAASVGNTFFPPVPAEMATVFAGYLASSGHGSLPVIITSTTLGMTVGNMGVYYLTHRYGTALLEKHPFDKIIKKEAYDRTAGWFGKYGIWTFFISKLVPGMSFCAVLASGMLRLNWLKALIGYFLSNLVVFAALALAGMSVESNWQKAYRLVNEVGLGIFITLILSALIAWCLARIFRQRRRRANQPEC